MNSLKITDFGAFMLLVKFLQQLITKEEKIDGNGEVINTDEI